jgi:hypothetical protein
VPDNVAGAGAHTFRLFVEVREKHKLFTLSPELQTGP